MRKIDGLGKWCVRMLWISIGSQLVVSAAIWGDWAGVIYWDDPNGNFDTLSLVSLIVMLIALVQVLTTYVMCGRWLVRAAFNASLMTTDTREKIYPGWAVGWFFVPILNFWKPYVSMRQTWNGSLRSGDALDTPAPSLVNWWWAMWILSSLMGYLSSALEGNPTQDALFASMVVVLASAPVSLFCTYLFLRIIETVTGAQTRDNIHETFA